MLLQQQEDLRAERQVGLRADRGQGQPERGPSTWSLWRWQTPAPENHSHAQSPMWHAPQPLQPPTPTQEAQLSDEEFARLLQREEDIRGATPVAEPSRPEMARPAGSWWPSAAASAATVLSSGALFGCCGGLQIAACFGLGHLMTWLCAIGGGIAGHVSGNRMPMGESVPQHEYDLYSEDTSDSDEPSRGLAQSIIEGHTVGHVYSGPAVSSSPQGQEERKCMVCMEPFVAGDALRALPCLHRYHQRCIDEWLTRSPECPICKRDITAAPVTPHFSAGSLGGARPTRRSVASLFPLRGGWTR